MLTLLVVERAFEQQRVHAHDQVHGRSDFVAHARQKIALGAVGRFGGLFGEIPVAADSGRARRYR